MKRTYIRNLLIMGVLLLIIGAGVVIKGGDAQADTPVALDSNVDPVISQSAVVSTASASQELNHFCRFTGASCR